MIQKTGYILILATFMLQACRNDELIQEQETEILTELDIVDWGAETHGNNVTPNYNVVFKQNEILRFDVKISSENWEAMQSDLSQNIGSNSGPGGQGGPGSLTDFDPIWVPCSFYFNNTEWYKVGIRFKGNSSLQSSYRRGVRKLSFKLDFDQYEDDYPVIENQRFYGFRQLNLKNNYDDASLMREKVASDLFYEFGLASPQTTFCVVYVDHGSGPQYFGVYTLVEEVDDTVLGSQFGNESGNLYKPDGTAATFAGGSFNESEMEKKNNEEQADYTDVLALYNALNNSDRQTDIEQWKNSLNAVFNVDIFLKWLAANTAMQNWDTYGKMTHNYYLYCNPSNSLLTWIPWDNNEALQEGKQGGTLSLALTEVSNQWPLIRYLVDVQEYEKHYQDYLFEFINDVFLQSKMNATYTNYYNLLKEHAYAEESGYTFLSNDASFDNAVETLKSHAQQRTDKVLGYLD